MPTDTKIEIVLGLSDGTKITRIENIEDVTSFLEQHVEFVKVVRCKDCKHSIYDELIPERWCNGRVVEDNHFCSYGERKEYEEDVEIVYGDDIDNAPTIDTVRHGRWEVAGNTTHYYTCSVCGKPGDGFDNYCRSCGALMGRPCDKCQEWDCYGCDYKQTERSE